VESVNRRPFTPLQVRALPLLDPPCYPAAPCFKNDLCPQWLVCRAPLVCPVARLAD
jgi:hypothetical protein